MTKKKKTGIVAGIKRKITSFASELILPPTIAVQGSFILTNSKYISWYQNSGNKFPDLMTQHFLRASVFSPIIQELVSFFTGEGFESSDSNVKKIIESANQKESLRKVFRKGLSNLTLTGNAWILLTFDSSNSWVFLSNVHSVNCRLSTKNTVFTRPTWNNFNIKSEDDEVETAIFPDFTNRDGLLYSFLHIKDDVAGFPNYAPPFWIAGLENSSIPQKVTNWNTNRIDSGFSVAGALLDASASDDPEESKKVIDRINEQYSGANGVGKIILMGSEGKLQIFDKTFDMDWTRFYTQSKAIIHTDLRFPASLTGDYGEKGFSKDRGQTDYNLFKPFMEDMQQLILEPISKAITEITGFNTSDLKVVNINPFKNEDDEQEII